MALTDETMVALSSQGVVLRGSIIDGGIICPLLKDENGDVIALIGVRRDQFSSGTCLELEGSIVKYSPCQQGNKAFNVSKIISINGKNKL